MKTRTQMHGQHIIRVKRVTCGEGGEISIENYRTKEKTVACIDSRGTIMLKDNKNPGRKVVDKALSIYKALG